MAAGGAEQGEEEQGELGEQVVATAAATAAATATAAALSVADISHLYCNKLCAIGVSRDVAKTSFSSAASCASCIVFFIIP